MSTPRSKTPARYELPTFVVLILIFFAASAYIAQYHPEPTELQKNLANACNWTWQAGFIGVMSRLLPEIDLVEKIVNIFRK